MLTGYSRSTSPSRRSRTPEEDPTQSWFGAGKAGNVRIVHLVFHRKGILFGVKGMAARQQDGRRHKQFAEASHRTQK